VGMIQVLPPMPSDPPQIWDWRQRLDIVTKHVGQLVMDRTIWRSTRDILKSNPATSEPPFFFHWATQNYYVTQTVGVRRQMDSRETHQQTMCRLLRALKNGSASLTREWFVDMYRDDPMMKAIGHADFDTFAGSDGHSVPPEWFDARHDRLAATIRPIRKYVNRRIAHVDNREVTVPAIAELDAAIDSLNDATVQLSLLLNASGLVGAEPIIQFDWTKGLDVAWLPPPNP
jgi:hypothetical protein